MWAPGYASAAATGTIAVCATDSTGANIVLGNDQAWYKVGSTNYVGAVGTSGCRESTLPAGTNVEVWVGKSGTFSQHLTGTVPDGSTLTFDFFTTKVTLEYAHSIAFGGPAGNSGWFKQTPATASQELFSDGSTPVHFRLDGTGGASARTTLSWPVATGPGATFNQTLFVVRLLDHNGDPLAGGIVDDYLGGWHNDLGQTDANGNYVLALPNDSSYLSVAVRYNGTRNQQSRAQANSSVFTFRTALAVVKLRDADGNPLDTGSAAYYAGGWQPSSDTSGGETSFEMLPGSYSFAMTYNHTRQQVNGVAISGPTTDVVFQTGRVTASFSQPFQWYNSQYYSFTTPSMEFLPGQIGLTLSAGCNTPKFPIAAGDHLVKSGVMATLVNSANHPLSGGTAAVYSGGWQSFTNPTNGYGKTCEAVDGLLSSAYTSVAMVYNGTRVQIDGQNPQSNSIYAFKTTDVTVELRDSDGGLLDDPGSASYYASGWHGIGATTAGKVHVQMLQGSYSFAMTYLGTSEQLNGQTVSGATSTVTFQTGKVISDSGNATSYYASGYWPFTSGMELLPGTYWFQFSDMAQTQYPLVGGTTNHIH
jgi:hypothetical protein